MKLEHYSEKRLKKEIVAAIDKYLDLSKYKVFLFGSRVSGASRAGSDIDIGIEGPKPIPGAVMTKLRESIDEIPTLYKIDLVDFSQVSAGFRKQAKKRVEILS